MGIIISSPGGGGGVGSGLADGDYGAFTVTSGVAELSPNSVTANTVPDGELPPVKLEGYTGVTGNDGDVIGKTSGEWTAVDELPYFSGFIPGAVADDTYVLVLKARRAFTIVRLVSDLVSGSCTLNLQIDGVSVTGISAVSQSTSELSTSATAANSVAVDQTVTLIVSGGSSPVGLAFQVDIDYA